MSLARPPEEAQRAAPRYPIEREGHPMNAGSVFTFPVRVYWEDTDAGGIVFYVNYLKFFERARTEWLRAKGVGQRALKDEVGGMFVVSETQVRYLRPARLDDALLVTVRVERFGAASLLLAQQVLDSDTPGAAVLCEGQIRIGWVDAATLRPARIPPSLLEHIAT
jgi:acyl-CoA thioester hydrolase